MDNFDVNKFLTETDFSKYPNAKEVILQYLNDNLELGEDEAERRQKILRARTSLRDYAELVYEISPARHHEAIIEFLEDESIKRGLIVSSPGSAKSTWTSGVYASHYFSTHPDESILLVSNTLDQAGKWSSSVRDIVDGSPEYREIFPEIQKDEDRGWTRLELNLANKQDRANVSPNLVAYGVGGPILGRRANIIIVDDPTSQSESRSPTQLTAQKDWFKATLMSRLVPGGRVLVILTRWGEDDLASMLINDMDFTVLHMPALGDPDKGAFADYILPPVYDEEGELDKEAYLAALRELKKKHEDAGYECEIVPSVSVNRHCVRKYLGYTCEHKQSIWPERFSVDEYLRVKKDYGSAQFKLIYQGDTSGSGGEFFKPQWYRYWGPNVTSTYEGDEGPVTELPMNCRWFQFTDIATGTTDKHDYFVILTIAVDERGRIFVEDVVRTRIEAPDQPKLIQTTYNKYPNTMWVLLESVAYQLSLFQNLSRTHMLPLKKFKPIKNKEARARSLAALYEAGRIYHKQNARWLEAFEHELAVFPKGKHDDQVDAFSGGIEELGLTYNHTARVIQVGFG